MKMTRRTALLTLIAIPTFAQTLKRPDPLAIPPRPHRDEPITVKQFKPGELIKGTSFDLLIIPGDEENPPKQWTIAIESHDSDSDEFIANVFYRTTGTIPGATEKSISLLLHETLNGPAYKGTMCMADKNISIPLSSVEFIRIRLLQARSESEVKLQK